MAERIRAQALPPEQTSPFLLVVQLYERPACGTEGSLGLMCNPMQHLLTNEGSQHHDAGYKYLFVGAPSRVTATLLEWATANVFGICATLVYTKACSLSSRQGPSGTSTAAVKHGRGCTQLRPVIFAYGLGSRTAMAQTRQAPQMSAGHLPSGSGQQDGRGLQGAGRIAAPLRIRVVATQLVYELHADLLCRELLGVQVWPLPPH